jgi:hypothetical protein
VNTAFSAIQSMFQANGSVFEKATQGIPDEKWLIQPGADSNHLMFIAGHVVVHRAFVPKYMGVEWSAPWVGFFHAAQRGSLQTNTQALARFRPHGRKFQRSLKQLCRRRLRNCWRNRSRKESHLSMERSEERSVCSAFMRRTTLVR